MAEIVRLANEKTLGSAEATKNGDALQHGKAFTQPSSKELTSNELTLEELEQRLKWSALRDEGGKGLLH